MSIRRRLRTVPIYSSLFGIVLRGQRDVAFTSDWPEDAQIVSADWDFDRQVVRLMVESNSFGEVSSGDVVPEWLPVLTAHAQAPEAKQLLDVIERMRKEDPS